MKLQVLAPTLGGDGFVLGRDLLDNGRLGDGGDDWQDILTDATGLTASRGGTTVALNALDGGAITAPLKGLDPSTDARLTTGRYVRLVDDDRAGDPVLWFGRITDTPAQDDRDTIRSTLLGADAVAMLSGAINGIGVHNVRDSLAVRVGRISAAAGVAIDYDEGDPIESVTDLLPLTWTAIAVPGGATVTAGADRRTMNTTPTAAVKEYDYGLRATLTGLTVGRRYAVSANVNNRRVAAPNNQRGNSLGIVGIGYADWKLGGTAVGAAPFLTYEFVATATSHVVEAVGAAADLASGDPVYVAVINPKLTTYIYEPPLQAHVQQGTAREHLDIACDSVLGAVWRPTTDYRIEVLRRPTTDVVATISDRGPDDLGLHEAGYIAIGHGYAPGDSVVNDVELTNLGRTAGGDAADTTTVYTQSVSAAVYGRKSVQVTTSLAVVADRDALGNAIVVDRSEPEWTPTSVSYRYDDLDVLPDLYDVVRIVRKGAEWLCRVVGLSYDFTSKGRRITTLTLRQV